MVVGVVGLPPVSLAREPTGSERSSILLIFISTHSPEIIPVCFYRYELVKNIFGNEMRYTYWHPRNHKKMSTLKKALVTANFITCTTLLSLFPV
jgi:hypothetical protein